MRAKAGRKVRGLPFKNAQARWPFKKDSVHLIFQGIKLKLKREACVWEYFILR